MESELKSESRSQRILGPWIQSQVVILGIPGVGVGKIIQPFHNLQFLNQISYSNGRIDQRKHVLSEIAPHLNVQKHLIT